MKICGTDINIRLHPHCFRHTFGVNLARKGVHMSVIAQVMGHADINTTYKYMHVPEDINLFM